MDTNPQPSRGRGRAQPRAVVGQRHAVGGDGMSSLASSVSSMNVSVGRNSEGSSGHNSGGSLGGSSGGSPVGSLGRNSEKKFAVSAALAVPGAQMDETPPLKGKMPKGTVGNAIQLYANYYKLILDNDGMMIYQYEISIVRPGSDRKFDRDINRAVFWQVVKSNPEVFGKPSNLIYDDMHCLWSAQRLFLDRGEGSLEVVNAFTNRIDFQLRIKYASSFIIDVSHNDALRRVAVQLFDALLTQQIRCPLTAISKHFYPYGCSVYLVASSEEERRRFSCKIDAGIELWNGVYGSVKVGSTGALLYNCDVSTSAFAKMKLNLIDFFLEIVNCEVPKRVSIRDFQDPVIAERLALDAKNRRKLKNGLTGLQLCLMYGDEAQKSRHFKFVDVGKPACVTKFFYNERNESGQIIGTHEMTVEEYFYKVKSIKLRYPNLPVIQVGPKAREIFIPMELLQLSEKPQKIKRNLTEFQKSAMLRKCAYDPSDRADRIQRLMQTQNITECEFLENFRVSINPQFLKLSGRVLPPPKIATEKDDINKYMPVSVENGTWKLDHRFTKCHDKIIFCVVSVLGCISEQEAMSPIRLLMETCELFGMRLATREHLFEAWDPDKQPLTPLLKYFRRETERCFPGAEDIVLFLMERKDPIYYSTIKKVCDLEEGIASQCILSKTFRQMARNNPSTNATAHNLCLKVNVKMGGVNNRIYPSNEKWIKFVDPSSPTLHVGVDVTHPGVGRRGNSIATVVANVDVEASRYEASVKVQLPSEERIVYMVETLTERLLAFYQANDRRPEHIIIYRDGISESEFAKTFCEEFGSIQAACMKLDETYKPTISYVVVQKRHHTRFFVARQQDGAGKNKNIPPGTVVEDVVTSQNYSDFFLASHLGAMGTTRPCHYYVLYDSWNCTADEWQELLYGLCHLYCRCNKAVSLPAPVFYAHLACARASVHSTALSSSSSSSVEGRSVQRGCRSELESTRTLQTDLRIANTTPKMYFV